MAAYSCPVRGLGAIGMMRDPIQAQEKIRREEVAAYRGSEYCFPLENLEYGYTGNRMTMDSLKRLQKLNKNRPPFNGEIVHDWPVRLQTGLGYHCNFCNRDFLMYIALSDEWEKLPSMLWSHILCLDCYKTYTWFAGHSPSDFKPEYGHLLEIASQWGAVNIHRTVHFLEWKNSPAVKRRLTELKNKRRMRRGG